MIDHAPRLPEGHEEADGTDNLEELNESYSTRSNWLRAAVLGANDGLVSVAAIMLGALPVLLSPKCSASCNLSEGNTRRGHTCMSSKLLPAGVSGGTPDSMRVLLLSGLSALVAGEHQSDLCSHAGVAQLSLLLSALTSVIQPILLWLQVPCLWQPVNGFQCPPSVTQVNMQAMLCHTNRLTCATGTTDMQLCSTWVWGMALSTAVPVTHLPACLQSKLMWTRRYSSSSPRRAGKPSWTSW